jgi:ribosomal protein S25
LLFFLEGVSEQSRDAIGRAKELQDLQLAWRAKLKEQKRVTGLVLGITDALFEKSVISAPEVARKFKVSHQGAMKALQGLEKLKVVKLLQDKQRNRMFVAKDILKIME